LRKALTKAGLKDVAMELFTETLKFDTGKELWTWVTSSNPVAQKVLSELNLSSGEREAIELALEGMIRERAGGNGSATLTVPINIGMGTK
jgi:hypothetical protein